MNRSHVRHLPVMHGDKLVGMLSERDVLAARARAEGNGWWGRPVSEAMRSPVQTAGPDDSLTEVAGRMAVGKIGAMPVVEFGKLLGIATVTDVLDAEVRSSMTPPSAPRLTAADAMTSYPLAVQEQTLLVDAVGIMIDHHVRHLPVVDLSSTIVGMLSDRDVRTAVGDPAQYLADPSATFAQYRVLDVMSRPGASVAFDMPIAELAHRFADERIGALPVTDRFGALIGIVSYVDVLRALAPAH
jgi:acetoin utilization protein AcuB